MDAQTKLLMLKHNLQRTQSTHQDEYLETLLDQAEMEVSNFGVADCSEKDLVVVDYAAFLFRCRANQDYTQTMPRHLDYRIKNLLWRQAAQ